MSTSSIIGISITIYLAIGIIWTHHNLTIILAYDEQLSEIHKNLGRMERIERYIITMVAGSVTWFPISIINLYQAIRE